MKLSKIIAAICTISFIFSCKKNKDTPAPVLNTYLSKEIIYNIGTYTWTYDAQNRVASVSFASSNEAANKSYNYTVNSFDAQNRIVEALYD